MKIKLLVLFAIVVAALFIKHSFDKTLNLKLANGPTLISNVNIVDVEQGTIVYNQDVMLSNGLITSITSHTANNIPPNSTSIDATGRFLMPGLWDMHTHSWKLSPQLHHPLFVASGVTTVRDMSGCLSKNDAFWACPHDRQHWNQQLENGLHVGPRYIEQSSYQTNGGNEVPGGFDDFFKLGNKADAQKLIEFYKQQGVESIKPYSELSFEQYTNLVQAAKLAQLKVAGHRPISVTLDTLLDLQQDSIEHARVFLFACHPQAIEFGQLADPIAAYNADYIRSMINLRDVESCNRLMQRMSQSNTWWSPTLTTLAMGAFAEQNMESPSPHSHYIPWLVKALLWNPDRKNSYTKGFDSNQQYVHLDAFNQAQADLKQAHDMGVRILAGTDSTDTDVYSGISLHTELAWMVEAGLTPAHAIKTATYNPAKYSGLLDTAGTVAVNKRADLVLLTDNPLNDIRNTTSIEAVFLNGQYVTQTDIQHLKDYASKMASSVVTNLTLIWDMLTSPLWRVQLID